MGGEDDDRYRLPTYNDASGKSVVIKGGLVDLSNTTKSGTLKILDQLSNRKSLAHAVHWLNLSNCGFTELPNLFSFDYLGIVDLSDNKIRSMPEKMPSIPWHRLKHLYMSGNPPPAQFAIYSNHPKQWMLSIQKHYEEKGPREAIATMVLAWNSKRDSLFHPLPRDLIRMLTAQIWKSRTDLSLWKEANNALRESSPKSEN